MKLTIDGKAVVARDGETILDCALRHDVHVPHLCTHPSLEAFGACRMCLVEVEGMEGYATSCSTPAAEGMVVRTGTPELKDLRRRILELIMLEHPNTCLVCERRDLCEQYRPEAEKAGCTTGCHSCNNKEVCQIRTLCAELNISPPAVPPVYRALPLERSDPFIDRDLNLCILCGRCVRICKEQHGSATIDFVNRGSDTHIGPAFGRSLFEAGCRFCGSCIDVCPTGALADRYAKWHGGPDTVTATTCIYCGAACAVELAGAKGRVVSARAVHPGVPICLLGRFAIAEFLNGADRLHVPYVRVGQVLRRTTWEEALQAAAERLGEFAGDGFALVCDSSSTLEDRHVFRKFASEVMRSDHYIEVEPDERGVSRAKLPKGTKAAWLTGDFVEPEQLQDLELLIVQDIFPTAASERADVVLPAAAFAEVEGTWQDETGRHRPLHRAAQPPGEAKPEWQIVSELAQAMDAEGFEYDSVDAIAAEIGVSGAELWVEREEAPPAAREPRERRTHFRGHRIEDKVPGLRELPVAGIAVPEPEPRGEGAFRILRKQELAPNVYEFVIEAPHVARAARAGQFVIVMVDEKSERVPYTLCDWDAEEGTITLVAQEVGLSSRKLILLGSGDAVAHVVGPLGTPLEMAQFGTVALVAGCYGLGAILPIARALKEAGNRVIAIVEARSYYLHYYGEQLEAASDELILTTIDGSAGVKGHALDVVAQRLEEGEVFDRIIAVGCPFMMMLTAQATQPHGAQTLVALNPIIVDGTGMCGACRVTVDEESKFACVDGPFFNGHLVDWDELWQRRAAYAREEVRAVERGEPVAARLPARQAGSGGACGHAH